MSEPNSLHACSILILVTCSLDHQCCAGFGFVCVWKAFSAVFIEIEIANNDCLVQRGSAFLVYAHFPTRFLMLMFPVGSIIVSGLLEKSMRMEEKE